MSPESPLQRLRRLEQQRQAAESGRRASSGDRGARLRRGGLGAILIAVVVGLATKGKLVLFFLATKGKLLLGALKLGPLLTTFSTMGISAWVYAKYFGAGLAVGVVVLILVHEIGHGVAARFMGLKVSAPVFIPFFGAAIMLKEQPRSTWVDAVVGYGGPLFGTIAGLAVALVGISIGTETEFGGLLVTTAWFTLFINLFNLTPVFHLDGDRISRPFRPWYWIPGLVLVVALIAWEVETRGRPNPFVLFVVLLGAIKAVRGFLRERRERSGRPAGRVVDRLRETDSYVDEETVETWQRATAAVAYFGLVAALTFLVGWTWGLRPPLG